MTSIVTGDAKTVGLRHGFAAGPRVATVFGVVAPRRPSGGPGVSWASSNVARATMLANRSKDTKPEVRLRSALHARGLRFRVTMRPVPGLNRTADIVFTRARVAVFVDGCFWHGCASHYVAPRANADYWRDKIERNQARDRDTESRLAAEGWHVIRVWEHDVSDVTADQILDVVTSR